MVSEVYGKCDGQNIIFRRNEQTGRWDAAVPFDNDGEYVVEVRAKDDVGNESYYATLLFIVDTSKLCVKIKVLQVSAQARKDGLHPIVKARMNKYKAQIKMCTAIRMTKYKARVIRCELCGRF